MMGASSLSIEIKVGIMKNILRGVGVMSGTSLDGLDLALCSFYEKNVGGYGFKMERCKVVHYSAELRAELQWAVELSAYDFIKLHRSYGKFIGNEVKAFLKDEAEEVHFVASHGHTTFHEPWNNVSFQIGDGATIAASCGITTVSDFRTYDIALGGQGAPLVPIGDMELFGEYDVCVNLGGFANLSFFSKDVHLKRIAFDICPVNYVVNKLVQVIGLEFDENGEVGASGVVDMALLDKLNGLSYYSALAPKSLGQEWVVAEFMPVLDSFKISLADKVRTCYEHFAMQISSELNKCGAKKSLFTGGGSRNLFLMELIMQKTKGEVVIPAPEIIDFKEAIIFGFLGYLRLLDRPNCLASVTGSTRDNIGGVVHRV